MPCLTAVDLPGLGPLCPPSPPLPPYGGVFLERVSTSSLKQGPGLG